MSTETPALHQAGPLLKWPGGKSKLLKELLARVPNEFNVYHEPFLGGGALFFALYSQGPDRRSASRRRFAIAR
jgi:DNA adenine methylase